MVGDLPVPEQVAGPGVDPHEVRVERAHVERFTQDGDTAVVPSTANPKVLRELVVVSPERTSGHGIDRRHIARRFGDEHDTVDDQRRRLGTVDLWDLVGPLQLELTNIAVVDLVEPAVPLAVERTRVH